MGEAAPRRAEHLVGSEKVAGYLRCLDEAASGFEDGAIQLLRIAFRRP